MALSTVGVWQDGRPLGNSIDVTSFHPNDRPTLSAIVRPVNRTAERLRVLYRLLPNTSSVSLLFVHLYPDALSGRSIGGDHHTFSLQRYCRVKLSLIDHPKSR